MHPVSVAIEADKQVFQFYKTGVVKASAGCGTRLDHGVLAVGYGVEAGTMYWKVKNSWYAPDPPEPRNTRPTPMVLILCGLRWPEVVARCGPRSWPDVARGLILVCAQQGPDVG